MATISEPRGPSGAAGATDAAPGMWRSLLQAEPTLKVCKVSTVWGAVSTSNPCLVQGPSVFFPYDLPT